MVRSSTSSRKKRTAYPALGAAPARKSNAWVIVILAALVVVNLYVFVWDKKTSVPAMQNRANAATPTMTLPAAPLPAVPDAVLAEHGSAAPAPVRPPGAIDVKVGNSDTLHNALKKKGLSADETD